MRLTRGVANVEASQLMHPLLDIADAERGGEDRFCIVKATVDGHEVLVVCGFQDGPRHLMMVPLLMTVPTTCDLKIAAATPDTNILAVDGHTIELMSQMVEQGIDPIGGAN
jgi:hypothetical protein